jgi:hypothetical protein
VTSRTAERCAFGARAFNETAFPLAGAMQEDGRMMFFKRKPALIKILAIAVPKPARYPAEIKIKTASKPDSDGRHRRMLRTVEDNRLL